MDNIAGHEKPTASALRLVVKVLQDIGCSDRDIATVTNRVADEGIEFLTKTLPTLGKALDRGLGNALFKLPSAFKKKWRSGEIPAFCSSLFSAVFERDGVLRKDADAFAIKKLRTLCFLVYKLQLPFSAKVTDSVLQDFADKDSDLPPLKVSIETVYARRLTTQVFGNFTVDEAPNPKHGKGVVSNIGLFDKWEFYPPQSKVVDHFGRRIFNHSAEMAIANFLTWVYAFMCCFTGFVLEFIPYKPTAKVICVPKDSRGPRLISCEPAEHQYIQQMLFAWTKDTLENHYVSRGSVNFTDQGINRELALIGSENREWSTLDLKDASDRVSLALVEYLFGDCPAFLASLLACRSTHTLIEKTNGAFHHELRKFAPMGSAVCFTTLAWVVYSLLVSSYMYRLDATVAEARDNIRVYGDDIIVRNDFAELAISTLEKHGLLVNKDKSFINSHFLESCGMDAFRGVCVTPVRARELLPHVDVLTSTKLKTWQVKKNLVDPECARRIVKTIALAQELSKGGYGSAAEYCYRLSEYYLGSRLPYGTTQSPYLCRWTKTSQEAWLSNRAMDLESKSKVGPTIVAYVKKSITVERQESGFGRLRRVLPIMGLSESNVPEMGVFEAPRKYVLRRRRLSRIWETAYGGGQVCAAG